MFHLLSSPSRVRGHNCAQPPQNPANLPQARALLAPWRFPLLDLARMFLERRSSVGYRGSAPARETLEVVLMLKCAKFTMRAKLIQKATK